MKAMDWFLLHSKLNSGVLKVSECSSNQEPNSLKKYVQNCARNCEDRNFMLRSKHKPKRAPKISLRAWTISPFNFLQTGPALNIKPIIHQSTVVLGWKSFEATCIGLLKTRCRNKSWRPLRPWFLQKGCSSSCTYSFKEEKGFPKMNEKAFVTNSVSI